MTASNPHVMRGPSHPGRSRRLLLLAFLAIAVVFIVSNGIALYRSEVIGRTAHAITQNMLGSVELASRMGQDVSRERRLVDAHILERETAAMVPIEVEIGKLQADFEKAASAYNPLAGVPGELEAFEKLKTDVEAIKIPLAKTLELSRRNQDVQAGASLHDIEGRLDNVTDDVDLLIRINREGADRQVQQLTVLRHSEIQVQTILTIIGIAVTLIVGWWALRIIGQREDDLAFYTSLLEERNKDLDAFAGRIAHDLRNPLSNINVAVTKLLKRVPAEDETIAIVRRGVVQMDNLIEDLLTLSRAGAQLVDSICDPAEAAAQVETDLVSRMENKGGTIHFDVAPARVHGSERLLTQALWNLADNAVKYRRPDVPIHLEIAGHPAKQIYELRVSDNGLGMTPGESGKAFDPFYRARRSTQPGTGLGLSIVKRVVEASGGTVSVFSQLGHGTTFVINLPLLNDSK